MMLSPSTILAGVGVAGLVVAAVTDLRSRTIPNAAVAWVLGAGALSRFAADGVAAWHSLAILVVVSLPLGVLAYRNVIGGGDAKMMAASVLLVSPAQTLELLLAIAVAGGFLSTIYLLLAARSAGPEAGPEAGAAAVDGVAGRWRSRLGAIELPYGPAILAGVALILARPA